MSRRFVLFAVALAASVACGSFGADGADTPGAGDGGTSSGSASSGSDASGLGDSPIPLARDSGIGAIPCGASPCIDFMGGLPTDWVPKSEGGSPLPYAADGIMVTELRAVETGALISRLQKDIISSVTHTHLAFELALDAATSIPLGNQVTIAELLCDPLPLDDKKEVRGVLINVLGPNYDVGATPLGTKPFPLDSGFVQLELGVSRHIDLDVTWTPTPSATLKIDGAEVSKDVALDQCAAHPNFTVRVGLGSATSQPAKAYYDNVVFEADP